MVILVIFICEVHENEIIIEGESGTDGLVFNPYECERLLWKRKCVNVITEWKQMN